MSRSSTPDPRGLALALRAVGPWTSIVGGLRRVAALAVLGLSPVIAARATDLRVTGLFLAPSATGFVEIELLATAPAVGVQVDLDYPATEFVLGPAERGPALASHALRDAEVAPGRRRMLVYSTRNDRLSNGVLARIPVTHVGAAGTGSFELPLAAALVATPDGLSHRPLNTVAGSILLGASAPPALSALTLTPEGGVRFVLSGTEGSTYQIEASDDLRSWIDLDRHTLLGREKVIQDLPPLAVRHRFYRARLVP